MNARDFILAMALLNLWRTALVFLAGGLTFAIALLATHGSRWHVPDPAMRARYVADSLRFLRTDSLVAAAQHASDSAIAAAGARVAVADTVTLPGPPVKERLRTLIITMPDSSSRATLRQLAEAHQAETKRWERKVFTRDSLVGLQRLRIATDSASIRLLTVQRDSAQAGRREAIEHTSRRPSLGSLLITGASCAAAGYLISEKETAPAMGLGAVCAYRLVRAAF